MRSATARLAPILALVTLAACTEQDASGVDRAVESFFGELFEFWFSMMLLVVMMILFWALIAAGAVAVIVAGIRRMRGGRQAVSEVPRASGAPGAPGVQPEPDWVGIAMIVGGGVLLLGASPWIFGIGFDFNDGGALGPLVLPGLVGAALVIGWTMRGRRGRRARREARAAQAARGSGYQAVQQSPMPAPPVAPASPDPTASPPAPLTPPAPAAAPVAARPKRAAARAAPRPKRPAAAEKRQASGKKAKPRPTRRSE